jgi:hypothetical protein
MSQIPEPASTNDLRALLLDYLDFYRSVVASKVSGISAEFLDTSVVPSGWTPSGLLNHLAHMERRWLHWGFMAEPVDDPWGDSEGEGWKAPQQEASTLIQQLTDVGRHTREVVENHHLDDRARVGGRFATPGEAPRLHWILLHVLQEYARHAGHLDIVRELTDGSTGEWG